MIDIIATIDLDQWYQQPVFQRESWLRDELTKVHRPVYQDRERILLTLSKGDEWLNDTVPAGLILTTLQKLLNQVDISNFFVIVHADPNSASTAAQEYLKTISADSTPITVSWEFPAAPRRYTRHNNSYSYNAPEPINISLNSLSEKNRDLLTKNKTFCIYPWIHLHTYPTGEAWPCCQADMAAGKVGNCKQNTLAEIWNGDRMKTLRNNMLNGRPDPLCVKCYEQESNGFFSGRASANKHHGHHIHRVDETKPDGTLDRFEMTYWDIRFSNFCNLSCRSCGHIFSSSWYQDQVKLAGEDWAKKNRALNIAGRDEEDMWNQLLPHLDYVEQIYFAGGEPMMMDEHYRILEELDRRGRYDVRLVYNTNFTHVKLKNRYVFDYWRKFKSVSVGASLDAMGDRAEYIRHGTDWFTIEENRRRMMVTCPNVDFYISPTLSIMNAWHLPDFHRDWVQKGLIKPQDLNVNILQDPPHYRIDIAPIKYKQRLRVKFEEHIEWLKSQDPLQRATVGFESAIKFMMATDNSHLIEQYKQKTAQLDEIRGESLLKAIPELEALYDENPTR